MAVAVSHVICIDNTDVAATKVIKGYARTCWLWGVIDEKKAADAAFLTFKNQC